MRPDEHKRKKNAQYKKKHGLSEKESKSDVKPKRGSKETKEENSTKTKTDPIAPKGVQENKVKKEEVVEEDSKHYRKRKIVSNWSRYDDSSDSEGGDDDIPLQRGEDFNKLLAEAGGSAAQFRFKDEEEWAEESQSAVAPVLALNLESLSESLSCIPLHERLEINESLFTEEQRDEMKAHSTEAEKKHASLTEHLPALIKTNGKVKGLDGSEKTDKSPLSAIKKSDMKPFDHNRSDLSQNKDPNEGNDTKKENTKNVALDDKKTSNKNLANKVRSKEVENLEDDLDIILSLDECIDKKVEYVKTVTGDVKVNTKKTVVKDKTADKLEKTTAKGDAKLEDWLDSMLDD